jgi:hypothetical protein
VWKRGLEILEVGSTSGVPTIRKWL